MFQSRTKFLRMDKCLGARGRSGALWPKVPKSHYQRRRLYEMITPCLQGLLLGMGAALAKMNWDRVRKESQERRSGSEWIGIDNAAPQPGGKPLKPKGPSPTHPSPDHLLPRHLSPMMPPTRTVRRSPISRMPGCVCKKAVGFAGLHKKRCPLAKSAETRFKCSNARNNSFGFEPTEISSRSLSRYYPVSFEVSNPKPALGLNASGLRLSLELGSRSGSSLIFNVETSSRGTLMVVSVPLKQPKAASFCLELRM